MVGKNQEMIEKYLDYLFKIGKCERAIVQNAIEEAGKIMLIAVFVSLLLITTVAFEKCLHFMRYFDTMTNILKP